MEQNTILVKPVTTMVVVPFMNTAFHVAFSQTRYNISASRLYYMNSKAFIDLTERSFARCSGESSWHLKSPLDFSD